MEPDEKNLCFKDDACGNCLNLCKRSSGGELEARINPFAVPVGEHF